MTIAELDPNDIKEIIETDSMITAVMNPDVAKKYIENIEDCEKITFEGMDLRLNGFDKIVKDGSEGVLFFKINLQLGQFMYATSDKPGSDEILAHFMPQFIKGSGETGLKLVDVRAVATESLGSMKRAKGVTTTEALLEIMKKEMEQAKSEGAV